MVATPTSRIQIPVLLSLVFAMGTGCKRHFNANVRSTNAQNEKCDAPQPRAVFDIGSGTTKFRVSLVKRCGNNVRLEKTCFYSNGPVPYSKNLVGPAKEIPATLVESARTVMTGLFNEAQEKMKVTCPHVGDLRKVPMRGIMTAVFRDAEFKSAWSAKASMSQFFTSLGKTDSVPLKVLSQDEEGFFGAFPVLTIPGIVPSQVAVWDMGAGSTQILTFSGTSAADAKASLLVANKVGTGTFVSGTAGGVAGVNARLKGKTLPGPGLNFQEVATAAVAMVREAMFKGEVQPLSPEQVTSLGQKMVFGIGGTWSGALPELLAFKVINGNTRALDLEALANLNVGALNSTSYSKQDVARLAQELGALDEAGLIAWAKGSKSEKFAATLSQSAMLAHAYLSNVPVERIIPLAVGGSDTAILHPDFDKLAYWNQDCPAMAAARLTPAQNIAALCAMPR